MKMLIIKLMDFIMYIVAALVVIVGMFSNEVLALLACIIGAVMLIASWCVFSKIAQDLHALRVLAEKKGQDSEHER